MDLTTEQIRDRRTYDPKINDVLLKILGSGLLRIRALGWSGDAAACASEADHLHNIPELIGKSERGYLFHYMYLMVPGYVARDPGAQERYATEWAKLGELVRKDNKRLNGDESKF